MPKPKVSILMLTYNRPQMIERAIKSVFSQRFTNWELLIVQDGENEETEARLCSWIKRDHRIKYYRRDRVGSIAEASNFGLEKACGEYVAIIDDDDFWATDHKIDHQVTFLDAHIDYVACGGGYIMVDADGRERGRFIKPQEDSLIKARALMANPIANSTSMFRRVIGGKPAMYDIRLKQFADWDFWLSVGAQGKLYNAPEFLAYYALWDGGSSFKHQQVNARAAIHIIRKHRAAYRGFPIAMALAYLYWCYAKLPIRVRQETYSWSSALKKRLTGVRSRV